MNTFLYKAPWSLKSASTVNFRPRVNSRPPGFLSQVPHGSQCPPGLPWDIGFWPPAVQDQVKCIHQSSTTRCPMEAGWENPLPHMSPLGESCHLCLAWVHTSRLRCSRVFSPAGQPPTQASFSSWPPESCRPHSRQRCLPCLHPCFQSCQLFFPCIFEMCFFRLPFPFSGLLSLAGCIPRSHWTHCHGPGRPRIPLPPHHLLFPASQAHLRFPGSALCLLLWSSWLTSCFSSCRFLGALRGPFGPHPGSELPWHFVDDTELSQHPFTRDHSRHGA